MVLNFDEKSKKCNFDQCVYYASGECTGNEERDACIDMALKMLGVSDGKNPGKEKHSRRSDL